MHSKTDSTTSSDLRTPFSSLNVSLEIQYRGKIDPSSAYCHRYSRLAISAHLRLGTSEVPRNFSMAVTFCEKLHDAPLGSRKPKPEPAILEKPALCVGRSLLFDLPEVNPYFLRCVGITASPCSQRSVKGWVPVEHRQPLNGWLCRQYRLCHARRFLQSHDENRLNQDARVKPRATAWRRANFSLDRMWEVNCGLSVTPDCKCGVCNNSKSDFQ